MWGQIAMKTFRKTTQIIYYISYKFTFISYILPHVTPENNEDNASHSSEREGNAFLDECKKDASKRRASLAAKMTSNLRRLSGAAELKIDITDSVSSNNPKYCNKKIKVWSLCFYNSKVEIKIHPSIQLNVG